MKFSIIIPIYNVEKYIERCLDSVIRQTYHKIECIIVNDCTPDDSMHIVESFLAQYKGDIDFKFICHPKNKGLSVARNSGVKIATGDYLFFLDSDDELELNAMQLFSEALNRYGNVDFLIGNIKVLGDFKYKPIRPFVYLDSNVDIRDAYLRGDWYVMAWGKLINRNFFIRNNLWFKEGLLHEDELFSFQLALSASSMVAIEECVYKYVLRENSITTHKKEKNYRDFLWIILENIHLTSKKVCDSLMRQKFVNYFLSILYGYTYNILGEKGLKIVEKRELVKEMKKILLELSDLGSINTPKLYLEYYFLKAPYVVIHVVGQIRNILRK